jgi:hypothetical protein
MNPRRKIAIYLTLKIDIHEDTGLEEDVHGGRMVVLPHETFHLPLKLREIVLATTHIKHFVIPSMLQP